MRDRYVDVPDYTEAHSPDSHAAIAAAAVVATASSGHTARDRVRHYLYAGADGGAVVLPGTVKDLAGELGLTHEALYRTLSEMEGDGEIARREGKMRFVSHSYDRDHM